ncbi:MAG: hypothetical protein H7Y61_14305, partial [Rhizobiales bacterium]|nr:hypothetical protein [Rhizobacter sp.]
MNTELRATQRLLTAARAERQLAEHRFRSVFNQQFQFMAILSPEGRVLDMSEQLPLDNGAVPRDQVIGKLFWETVWWQHAPEMRARWPERLREAVRAGRP